MLPAMDSLAVSPIAPAAPRQAGTRSAAVPRFANAAQAPSAPQTTASRADPLVAFEAVVLRTFVEAMLPKQGFGEGTAGHMWRGQMADALADTLARSGGVGIAAQITKEVA